MNVNLRILSSRISRLREIYHTYKTENSVNEVELYENLCDVLSWGEICIKQICEFREDSGIISAIKYANNMKKHSVSIYTYTLESYAIYPSQTSFPSENLFPSKFEIKWGKLPLDDTRFKNQYTNYNKYLKGKNIMTTIDKIYEIIERNYKSTMG